MGIPFTSYYEGLDNEDIFMKTRGDLIGFIVMPIYKLLYTYLEGELNIFTKKL